MEDIYVNVYYDKSVHSGPSTNQTGPRSSDRRLYGAVVLCLGLLSLFMLVGLIVLGVHYYNSSHAAAAELATIKSNLTELLQDYEDKVSILTEQRDQLIDRLNTTTEELNKLQKKTCPAGWTMFKSSCYLLSTESGSWTKARDDCRNRGSDLVVITSAEEQTFLLEFTKEETWIGLNDQDAEGTWTWIDGTPLTLNYWSDQQPDNGNEDPIWGEEDCVHIRQGGASKWNDRSCEASLPWICEKNFPSPDVQE
ncbi:hypothetical protein Q5P01_013929 [Channa striata]|uniref:C-type lectin domain-containing protein n=1 Tax=Channa striata TaxID=64152 RepID=A0AA88MNT8_CHASR|nr:hypothetical protein Q5P01_013929 [Channa striata]